jgi:hypothetical protein
MILELSALILAGKIIAGVTGSVTALLLPPLVKYSYDKSIKRRLALERSNAEGRGRVAVTDTIDADHIQALQPHIDAVRGRNIDRDLEIETFAADVPRAEISRFRNNNPVQTIDIDCEDSDLLVGTKPYRVRHRFRWARYLADVAAGRYPLSQRSQAHDLVIRKYMREHLEAEVADLRKCDYRYILDDAVEEYYILPKAELQQRRAYNSYPVWKRRQECAAEIGALVTWKPMFPFSEAFGLRKKVVRPEGR